jgi:CBS domain-containing protein
MTIGEFCNREVIILNREDTVFEAAKLMRKYHVGDVVVVEQRGDKRVPVGILTDRDIVVELVALEVDITKILVGDAMSNELLMVHENEQLTDLVQKMQGKAVRRVPVVDDNGALVGIVTADDLIDLIAEQLTSLVGMVQREQHRERRTRVV